jgi:hypothetical protein
MEPVVAEPPSLHTLAVTEAVRGLLQGPPDAARLEQALRQLAKWRAGLVANTLVKRSGSRVMSGPFKGMDYAVRAAEGSQAARLLGCYEASLAPVIEAIVAGGYRLIIDIGAAEGYYAVGLALRMPEARVWARDADPRAQALCRRLAEVNAVADRVEIGGRMGPGDFGICAAQKTLVLCDIEGGEAELLDPARAEGLLAADLLVETHEGFRPGICAAIAARFRDSHHVQMIGRQLVDPGLPDWMERFSDLDRLLALWEWRTGPTPWLWMQRK